MKTIRKENNNLKKKEVKYSLDKCVNAPHAEMARNSDTDQPCEIE